MSHYIVAEDPLLLFAMLGLPPGKGGAGLYSHIDHVARSRCERHAGMACLYFG